MFHFLSCQRKQIYVFLLSDIRIDVELPIVVNTGIIGAMLMAQNASKGLSTRHVETQYHFIRERVEEGTFKLEFSRSYGNDSEGVQMTCEDVLKKKRKRKLFENGIEIDSHAQFI
jgi:hypothetical protein